MPSYPQALQPYRPQIQQYGRYGAYVTAGQAAYRFAKPYVYSAAKGAYSHAQGYFKKSAKARTAAASKVRSARKVIAHKGFKASKKGLKSRVQKIEKFVATQTSSHIQRDRDANTISCLVRKVEHFCFGINELSTIKTACDALKFFNPSAPATLITANIEASLFAQDIQISSYQRFSLKNNYGLPAKVTIYECYIKADTTIGALSAYGNGLANIPSGLGAYAKTNPQLYVNDSAELNKLYRVKKVKTAILHPGQGCSVSMNRPMIDYKPAVADNHTSEFQRALKYGCFMIRIEGLIAHDTTADEQLHTVAKLDYEWVKVYTVKYSSGGNDLHDIEVIDDTSASFSNGPISVDHRNGYPYDFAALKAMPCDIIAPLGTGAIGTGIRTTDFDDT